MKTICKSSFDKIVCPTTTRINISMPWKNSFFQILKINSHTYTITTLFSLSRQQSAINKSLTTFEPGDNNYNQSHTYADEQVAFGETTKLSDRKFEESLVTITVNLLNEQWENMRKMKKKKKKKGSKCEEDWTEGVIWRGARGRRRRHGANWFKLSWTICLLLFIFSFWGSNSFEVIWLDGGGIFLGGR